MRLLRIGLHPRHACQVLGRIGVVGQKVLVGVEIDTPVVLDAERCEQFLHQETFGSGLFSQQGLVYRYRNVGGPITVERRLRPGRGLQHVLRFFYVAVLEQGHLCQNRFPHRPQHAQHAADGGFDRRLGPALGDILEPTANDGQQAIRLLVHPQQRQRASRAQILHRVSAQGVQRRCFQDPVFFFAGRVPQLHQVVAERAAPERVHHVQGGALLGQMGVRNVVRRQTVRRQAQGARQQLQGVFILGQQRVFSRRRGRGALLRRAVAGRRRFGVVRRRSQRNEAQSVRVALRRQQVGQFGGAGLRVFGPFDADDDQALQRSAGEVKWLRVVQLRKDVDGLLADHQRHAFVEGDVEVDQPGALATQQRFRLACVQPVGR